MEQTKIYNKRLNIEEKRYKAKKIINLLNEHYNVDCSTLKRNHSLLIPRQIAIYFIDKFIPMVDREIALLFIRENGKPLDHATIIHSKNKIADLLPFDKEIRNTVNDLEQSVNDIAKLTGLELIKFKIKEEILFKIKDFDVNSLNELSVNIAVL